MCGCVRARAPTGPASLPGTPGAALVPAERWPRSSVLSVEDFAECHVLAKKGLCQGEGPLSPGEAERLTARCWPRPALRSLPVDLGPAGQLAVAAASLLQRGSAATFQTSNQGARALSAYQPRAAVFPCLSSPILRSAWQGEVVIISVL